MPCSVGGAGYLCWSAMVLQYPHHTQAPWTTQPGVPPETTKQSTSTRNSKESGLFTTLLSPKGITITIIIIIISKNNNNLCGL